MLKNFVFPCEVIYGSGDDSPMTIVRTIDGRVISVLDYVPDYFDNFVKSLDVR